MNIPATKEEILENFKQNSNGRPLNKDDYEIAEALSRITYKAYEVGMEDAKQLYMEDMMDNKRCNALHVFKNKTFGQLRTIEENGKILFCASDVAKALGYTNAPDAVKRHCRYTVKHSTPHPQPGDFPVIPPKRRTFYHSFYLFCIKPLQRWRKDYASRRHRQHRARKVAATLRRCAPLR